MVPTFYGNTGDAVNERQVAVALSKQTKKILVITLVKLRQYSAIKRSKSALGLPHNLAVIEIPVIFPVIAVQMFFLSIATALIFSIPKFRRTIDFIYVRSSLLAFGLMLSDNLAKITLVKFPAILEDEIQFRSKTLKRTISWMSSLADRLCIVRAGKSASPSPLQGKILAQRRKLMPRGPFVILPAGIDLQLIRTIRATTSETDHDDLRIGFLGLLSWWQGVDVLCQAVAIVKEKQPRVILSIIGDGEMRAAIISLCERLGVKYEISKFVPHETALSLLGGVNVLVVPSKKTSSTEAIIPIKIMEAWALGVPVIATDHQVLRNLFKDGEDLLLSPPVPHQVAERILQLLGDPNLEQTLVKNGLKLAEQFSYTNIADEILQNICHS